MESLSVMTVMSRNNMPKTKEIGCNGSALGMGLEFPNCKSGHSDKDSIRTVYEWDHCPLQAITVPYRIDSLL